MAASANYPGLFWGITPKFSQALFDFHKHRPYHHPVFVRIAGFIVAATGNQRYPGQFLVFNDRRDCFRSHLHHLPDLVHVLRSPGVDNHFISPPQPIKVHEWARVAISIIDMPGQGRVTCMSREGRAIQPSGIIPQPGDIPLPICLRYTHDRHLHPQARDLQPQVTQFSIGLIGRLCGESRYPVLGKP